MVCPSAKTKLSVLRLHLVSSFLPISGALVFFSMHLQIIFFLPLFPESIVAPPVAGDLDQELQKCSKLRCSCIYIVAGDLLPTLAKNFHGSIECSCHFR